MSRVLTLLLPGIVIAGFMDYIENYFIYRALNDPLTDARMIWISAILKFILLSSVAVYLIFQMCRQGLLKRSFQVLSQYITATIILIWNFRITVFCLILFFWHFGEWIRVVIYC